MAPNARFEQAVEIFHQACDLPEDQHAEFLDKACGGDAELRGEVESLLQHDESDDSAIRAAEAGEVVQALAASATDDTPEAPPEQIGKFRVIRTIGHGGMGTVYEAEQENPKRRVALKVIRAGLMSASILKRFQREAHVLGRLQHSGIAHIYEAGHAEIRGTRFPFFAMEYIDGLPIDTFLARRGLCERARMELLARVCDAVHYAHEKGIIHRDLKPANILVVAEGDGDSGERPLAPLHHDTRPSCPAYDQCRGRPKVLDFGVARITESDLQIVTLQTEVGQLVGTLSYMSPEQVSGGSCELDRRCDVYALGVIGHELLAGKLPHDIRRRTIPEAVRIIHDEEPSRLGSINSLYRGDIETIFSKALEKDRERRYQSAAEMASDIRRFLRDDPIQARPTSTFYQFRKFARRNRALVGGVAATLVSLLIGIIGVTWLALREADAHRATRAFALKSEQSAYRSSIAAASAALREQDIATAERHLLAAPESLRGWEWQHFHSMLDESIASAPIREQSKIDNMRGVGQVWFAESDRVVYSAQRRPEKPNGLYVESRDATTLELLSSWKMNGVRPFAPTQDGRRVMVRLEDGRIELRDAGSGKPLRLLGDKKLPRWERIAGRVPDALLDGRLARFADARIAEQVPWFVEFGSNGASMLGARKQSAVIFSFEKDEPVVLEDHPEFVASAAFFSDDELLVTAGYDRRLACFDLVNDGRRVWERKNAHNDAILAVAVSPDGSMLASGGQDRVLRFWDARSGEPLGELVGHREPILAVSFSESGQQVVTSDATAVKTWHLSALDDLNVIRAHDIPILALAISPDGAMLASGARKLRLWDASTCLLICELATPVDNRRTDRLEFSADGTRLLARLACGGFSHMAYYDVRDGKPRRFTENQTSLSWLGPEGKFILHSGKNGVQLLDHEDFKSVASFSNRILGRWFDWKGQQLASLKRESVTVYEIPSGEILQHWTRPMGDSLELIKDGEMLAASTPDRGIALLNIESGDEVAVLRGHSEKIHSMVELNGCERLASGSDDRTIRLWNIETFEEVAELRGHLDAVQVVVATPDGRTLFSASGDYTLRRWDTRPLRELLKARDEYARIAARLQPKVDTWLSEAEDAVKVADRINADQTLTTRERQIARQLLLKSQSHDPLPWNED